MTKEKRLTPIPDLRGKNPEDIMATPMSLDQYARVYKGLKRRLMINIPVPTDVEIAIMGNKNPLPQTFRLRGHDRQPLQGVDNPGKSAHIAFTRDIVLAYLAMMGRYPRREDHLFIVPSKALDEIGFSAIYLPTNKHPLHVRLTPHRLDSSDDIPLQSREKLVELLKAHRVTDLSRLRGHERFLRA